jgi:hypothetical protein
MEQKMKRILMIAPASYPVFGAESIVNIKLLQTLSKYGFEVDLISKRSKWEDYPSKPFESFGIHLNSINVIESNNKITPATIVEHIASYLIFGASFAGSNWAVKALGTAKQLIKKNKYDYILTKNTPGELIGYYIKKKYRLKWIATWNDPYPRLKNPYPYGNGIDAKIFFLQKKIISIMRNHVDTHINKKRELRDNPARLHTVRKNKGKYSG